MADFTFLFNRKGAIYPLDVQTSRGQRLFNSATGNEWPFNNLLDSTLVHLCCKVLVNMSDSQLAAVADVVPAELFLSLFKASLFPVRDGAIDILINKWPFKSLVVSKYISNMFSSMVVMYSDTEMCQRTRLGVKYSADIVHSFIDALRARRTKLRYLDMSGLPIAEIIIKYVATHCRLAHKEHQRNCLIDEYMQNVTDLETLCDKTNAHLSATTPDTTTSTSTTTNGNIRAEMAAAVDVNKLEIAHTNALIRNDIKKTTSLPDEEIIFKFDCILQERSTFDELMGALEANDANSTFRLHISKLDLFCLGKTNIIKLLRKLEKNHIEGLRLQYNSITEESIKDIIPLISQLSNLRSLDLSCNLIDYRQNPECSRQMSAAFGQLPHLNRLDLSGSPLGGCLSSLLGSLKHPLQYLSLHSCSLVESDLYYLANSPHVVVEHLDLSENRLTRCNEALVILLKRCSPYLCVLEVCDNRFDCIDFLTIVCVARKMAKLKLLATKGTFEMNDHLLGAEFMQHAPSLLAWRISYPIDVYDPNESDVVAQEALKRAFIERIQLIVRDKFKLVVSELFA